MFSVIVASTRNGPFLIVPETFRIMLLANPSSIYGAVKDVQCILTPLEFEKDRIIEACFPNFLSLFVGLTSSEI